jgi:hypothetical protein
MYDVLNVLTGETMTCTADPRRARMLAAPMEFHRVVRDMGGTWAFCHLPPRRWNEEHPADVHGRAHLQARLAAILAERRSAENS